MQLKSKTRLKSCIVMYVSDLVHLGENKDIASCNIFAVKSNPLEEFPSRFLFCHEVNRLLEYMYGQGPQAPSIEIQ